MRATLFITILGILFTSLCAAQPYSARTVGMAGMHLAVRDLESDVYRNPARMRESTGFSITTRPVYLPSGSEINSSSTTGDTSLGTLGSTGWARTSSWDVPATAAYSLGAVAIGTTISYSRLTHRSTYTDTQGPASATTSTVSTSRDTYPGLSLSVRTSYDLDFAAVGIEGRFSGIDGTRIVSAESTEPPSPRSTQIESSDQVRGSGGRLGLLVGSSESFDLSCSVSRTKTDVESRDVRHVENGVQQPDTSLLSATARTVCTEFLAESRFRITERLLAALGYRWGKTSFDHPSTVYSFDPVLWIDRYFPADETNECTVNNLCAGLCLTISRGVLFAGEVEYQRATLELDRKNLSPLALVPPGSPVLRSHDIIHDFAVRIGAEVEVSDGLLLRAGTEARSRNRSHESIWLLSSSTSHSQDAGVFTTASGGLSWHRLPFTIACAVSAHSVPLSMVRIAPAELDPIAAEFPEFITLSTLAVSYVVSVGVEL